MPRSLEFILKRAQATADAQTSVQAKWVSDEKPPASWATDIKALRDQQALVAVNEADFKAKRELYQSALDTLHDRTAQALAMMKIRFRKQPAKLAVIKNLKARGDSEEAILNEALSLAAKWGELDPDWNPTTDNTLAALTALRDRVLSPLKTDAEKARTAWRSTAETMNSMAAWLDDASVAWYAGATRVFPAGTPEGDMIRGTIPTTTPEDHHPKTPAPTPPAA